MNGWIKELWDGFIGLIGVWALMVIIIGSIMLYTDMVRLDCNTHGLCLLYLK